MRLLAGGARGAFAACLGGALMAGCSASDAGDERSPAGGGGEQAGREGERAARGGDRSAGERLRPSRCPADAANCATATGRIIYVERVDPDGDGDAHFVLASRESITGPGISVIDVRKSLRPSPLPGPGDRLSAAGPVFRGSYDQKQIEAIEVHVAYGGGGG